jgi:tetraprenyl-beta-curcumene synthase
VRVAVKETAATLAALIAYVATVLPRVRRELRQLGPQPADKAKNAEAVAVFATLAPRARRTAVVRAIVALQVAIDLRDELEESGEEESAEVTARLDSTEARWRRALAELPSHHVVLPLLERAIHRCEQGQLQTHRATGDGSDSLRRWAEALGAAPGYRWWEVAAGASSSVAAHALIAAAAQPEVSAETAAAIDDAYNPSIGALTVFLDDLVDREADRAAGEHNYLGYYEDSGEAAERLGWIAEEAGRRLESLPHASRHRAILAGVGAFYLSEPAAATPYAQPIKRRLLAALGPGTRALSAFMRFRG